ncbi:hypothetical protein EYF80_059969 [Liparis tanakae]|uniref:Tyr recombinase domain-containing protein n=1 Tax=Liparis tanakae TaxID=230148 RepID=A0A4Z2EMU3_9TELE|nr:hypothetical protein EYF80_059969 [Liparis tanakae]
MTPSRESSICPLCLRIYQALAQHLKRAHAVFNVHERKLLLSMASGRVNIRRCCCTISGCNYHGTRLDKHLQDGHPELTRNRLMNEEQAVKKAAAVTLLGCLRATHPQVAMVSTFDVVESVPDQLQAVHEVDPGVVVCQVPDCVRMRAELQEKTVTNQRQERDSIVHLKTIKVQARKLRRYQVLLREAKAGVVGSLEKEKEVEVVVEVDERVAEEEMTVEERVEEEMTVEERVEEVETRAEAVEAGPSRQLRLQLQLQRTTFKGKGRASAMRHLVLPHSIEQFLADYAAYQRGIRPTLKQAENATSKVSRVRSFLFHLSAGKSNLASWAFLNDMPAITKYAEQLLEEGKEVTTISCYLRNIIQFLGYMKETPPRACRLRRNDIHGVIRAVQMAVKNVGRSIVAHQLKVKAKKMANIVSRESLKRCQERAKVVIPELLTRMEDEGCADTRDDFYGYISAYIISIYGHRPGVLTNMTVSEVEVAKEAHLLPNETGYIITIDEHKTNRDFGGAQIFLTVQEFDWLERWLKVRKRMGSKSERVFVTRGDKPLKNLVRYMQTAWAHMGLPGRPTFTDLRTAVSGHVRNIHNETNRDRLARFMCHSTSTADRFYSLSLDRSQARDLRGHFDEVTSSISTTFQNQDQDSGESAAAAEEEDAEEMEENNNDMNIGVCHSK